MLRTRNMVVTFCIASLSLSTLAGEAPSRMAAAPALVAGIKVQPDKAPDCSSLKAIAESVTRGCKNNDEKAIAVYNFMILTHYHRNYPNEPGGLSVLKEINCYGWSLCGGLHSEQSAIWRELGWNWRFVGWDGHTTVEAQYDGRWHYLDAFLKFYAWMPDGKGGRTIAGEDDLSNNAQTLVTGAFELDKARNCVYAKNNAFVTSGEQVNWQAPALLSCGDTLDGVVKGLKSHRAGNSADSWMGINHATGSYSTDVNLAPGYAIENTWDAQTNAWFWIGNKMAPRHTCPGHKDTRNDPAYGLVLEPYINSKPGRSYANGMLNFAPDLASEAVLKSFASTDNVKHVGKALVPVAAGAPGRVTFSLATPYMFTQASGEAVGADIVEVSTNGGVTFVAVDVKDFSQEINGHLEVLVRVTFKESLLALKVQAVFQNNPGALPYLSPGRNEVNVSVADPKSLGNNQLIVTYAYRLGSRAKSFAKLCADGREIAKQHNAKWSDTITVVQKRFSAKDLPAKIVIDCPTPKGQYPVYPRMVSVRREVVVPGGVVQPLPAGAEEAKVASEAELQTLPSPFLVGTQPPPAWAASGSKEKTLEGGAGDMSSPIGGGIPVKSDETMKIPLTYVNFLNDKGESGVRGALRWPKASDAPGKVVAGMVLVKGDLKKLAGKHIAAVRLVVPVAESHKSAPAKLGAFLLVVPPDFRKAFKEGGLPEVAGTCIVPLREMPYNPAKPFSIDVTDAVKASVKSATPFYGFALRLVPDREVDNGYTVSCKISPTDPVILEADLVTK
ncbi:MAG: hypothetical protein WCS52_01525 [bacterium]